MKSRKINNTSYIRILFLFQDIYSVANNCADTDTGD